MPWSTCHGQQAAFRRTCSSLASTLMRRPPGGSCLAMRAAPYLPARERRVHTEPALMKETYGPVLLVLRCADAWVQR